MSQQPSTRQELYDLVRRILDVPHQQLDKQFIVGIRYGLVGLWEAKGRGKKATWKEEDWEAVEKWLGEERSYSARQLSQKLAVEKQIKLGAEQVKRSSNNEVIRV